MSMLVSITVFRMSSHVPGTLLTLCIALYGGLVNEWLSVNAKKDEGNFEHLGRKEMHEQRQKWEDMVFSARDTDTRDFEQYLMTLFNSSKNVTSAYYVLRYETDKFEKTFETVVRISATACAL